MKTIPIWGWQAKESCSFYMLLSSDLKQCMVGNRSTPWHALVSSWELSQLFFSGCVVRSSWWEVVPLPPFWMGLNFCQHLSTVHSSNGPVFEQGCWAAFFRRQLKEQLSQQFTPSAEFLSILEAQFYLVTKYSEVIPAKGWPWSVHCLPSKNTVGALWEVALRPGLGGVGFERLLAGGFSVKKGGSSEFWVDKLDDFGTKCSFEMVSNIEVRAARRAAGPDMLEISFLGNGPWSFPFGITNDGVSHGFRMKGIHVMNLSSLQFSEGLFGPALSKKTKCSTEGLDTKWDYHLQASSILAIRLEERRQRRHHSPRLWGADPGAFSGFGAAGGRETNTVPAQKDTQGVNKNGWIK